MIVLSFALHIWSSTSKCSCSSSNDVILLLDKRRRFHLWFFKAHHCLSNCTRVSMVWGERKGLRFHKNSIRATRENITKLSDNRRRGNKHISHIRHRRHNPSLRLTIRHATRIIPQVTPRIATALQISPLTQKVQRLPLKQNPHIFL